MTDETTGGLGNEPAAPDLDSILDKAIEQHTPDEAAPAEAAPVETEPKAEHPTDPTRYADGTFKPQKTDSADKTVSETEPAVEPAKAEVPAQPDPAPVQPIEAPARWTAEEKAKFAAWPRDVQEAVVERYRAIEADYTRKTQEAAEIRKSAEPLLNAVKPYEQYLSQIAPIVGQTPDQMISSLLSVEYQLRTGSPAQKVQAFHQIAQSYGLDLAAISRGEVPQGPDPLHQLHQEIAGLKQQLSQYGQQSQEWEQQRAVQELEAFSSAKDEAGRPRYPHFERVRGIMAQISQREPSLNLEQLYQKAVEPINTAIAEGLKSQQEAAERERLASIEKAKKAAPVKSSGSAPNGAAKAKDLDSILSQAIDARMA